MLQANVAKFNKTNFKNSASNQLAVTKSKTGSLKPKILTITTTCLSLDATSKPREF